MIVDWCLNPCVISVSIFQYERLNLNYLNSLGLVNKLGYLKIIFYFNNGFYCNLFCLPLSPGKTTHKTQFELPQLKSQKIKNFKTMRYTPVSNTDRYRPVCSKIEGVKKLSYVESYVTLKCLMCTHIFFTKKVITFLNWM